MKILVLSDSHGRVGKMREILEMHKNADKVIFLGDGIRDAIDNIENKEKILLLGNCDSPMFYTMGYDYDYTLDVDGTKIFCCHGHKYGVKYGLETLRRTAEERGCALALYGHTHRQLESREDGPILFNPGSVADGNFGLVYIENGAVVVSGGSLRI